MASPSSTPSTSNNGTTAATPAGNKHALTAVERQRANLSKLLKDPAKPAYIPPPPKEKTLRPPREMMKNVQGSSAGAGSGEFHVYKANRRREYERLKIMEEATQKESEAREFERKKREREEQTEAKTMKNRAKRLKKKERAQKNGKGKGNEEAGETETAREGGEGDVPIKKRRLVNGSEVVFRQPGGESDEDAGGEDDSEDAGHAGTQVEEEELEVAPATAARPAVTIYDSDT